VASFFPLKGKARVQTVIAWLVLFGLSVLTIAFVLHPWDL